MQIKVSKLILSIININAPPVHTTKMSLVVTANMSPNNNPIISNLIKVKKPITTNPTANEEWAKRPSKASPGKFVFFWSCINIKAITDEIKNTERAIFKSKL